MKIRLFEGKILTPFADRFEYEKEKGSERGPARPEQLSRQALSGPVSDQEQTHLLPPSPFTFLHPFPSKPRHFPISPIQLFFVWFLRVKFSFHSPTPNFHPKFMGTDFENRRKWLFFFDFLIFSPQLFLFSMDFYEFYLSLLFPPKHFSSIAFIRNNSFLSIFFICFFYQSIIVPLFRGLLPSSEINKIVVDIFSLLFSRAHRFFPKFSIFGKLAPFHEDPNFVGNVVSSEFISNRSFSRVLKKLIGSVRLFGWWLAEINVENFISLTYLSNIQDIVKLSPWKFDYDFYPGIVIIFNDRWLLNLTVGQTNIL